MELKEAERISLSGEPITASEYREAYKTLEDAAATRLLAFLVVALTSLAVVGFLWYFGHLSWVSWLVIGLANLVFLHRAGSADARVKFLVNTRNVIGM